MIFNYDLGILYKILDFFKWVINYFDLRRPHEHQNRFWLFPTISKCNSLFWHTVWFQSRRCKQQWNTFFSLLGGAYQQQNLWKKRCQWLVGFKRRCLFLPHLAQLAPIIKFQVVHAPLLSRTTDTQWRHKSKKSKILGRCGRQNMLRPHLKIWKWEVIYGRAVKMISSPGVRRQCHQPSPI